MHPTPVSLFLSMQKPLRHDSLCPHFLSTNPLFSFSLYEPTSPLFLSLTINTAFDPALSLSLYIYPDKYHPLSEGVRMPYLCCPSWGTAINLCDIKKKKRGSVFPSLFYFYCLIWICIFFGCHYMFLVCFCFYHYFIFITCEIWVSHVCMNLNNFF